MAKHTLFVYGTLIGKDRISRFLDEEDKIISIKPGFIEGKMYDGNVPMVFEIGEFTKNKMPNICFGAVMEIESNNVDFFKHLDAYEGCSRFMLGKNSKNDLYIRKKATAFEIDAKTIEDLAEINYNIVEKKEAWVYFGNPHGLASKRTVGYRNRIFYWDTFLELFE